MLWIYFHQDVATEKSLALDSGFWNPRPELGGAAIRPETQDDAESAQDPSVVCRFKPGAATPECATRSAEFLSITRTTEELSVNCSDEAAPIDVKCERGWRALNVAGPLDFSLTGSSHHSQRPSPKRA
jgi:hypothetical protein